MSTPRLIEVKTTRAKKDYVTSASDIPRLQLPQSDVTTKTLTQGYAQFNAEDFYDCHETLEPLWLAATGTERIAYHALIQAAIALCHHQRGNQKGALSLHTRAQSKLKKLPSRWRGLDIAQFSLSLEAFFASVYASPAEAIAYPRMQLTSD